MRRLIFPLCSLLLSMALCLVLAEALFRFAVLSDAAPASRLRHPDLYADWFSDDDYWKLQYQFGGQLKPPKQPHPILGWIGDFSPGDYLHNKARELKGRRPVLLYGDSFAQCAVSPCFQDLLNSSRHFSARYFLLNYGVGGYGVDQIYLLLDRSVHLYDDPIVVFSLMVFDLDRSILSVRTGQKPYFEITDRGLVLKGVPINPDPERFFSENPPQILSYLYKFILNSRHLPASLVETLRGADAIIDKKKKINRRLISEAVEGLRSRGVDFFVLIFHPHWLGHSVLDGPDGWRDEFLRELLQELDVPYIWSRDIFRADTKRKPPDIYRYISSTDGHPTEYFNRLIARELEREILRVDQARGRNQL